MTVHARAPRHRHHVLVVAVVVVVLAAGGVAVARWTSAGSGSSSAASGTSDPLVLTPGTAVAGLYPGGSAAVQVSVQNQSSTDLRLSALALATDEGINGFDVDPAHAGCDASRLGYATQTNGGTGWSVPAGGTVSLTLAAAITMSLDADDACQGATFNVHLTATG